MKFLHLSDLHYKNGFKADANFRIFKDHLFEKLKQENKKEQFDFICFSGDLVYGGGNSEYEEFNIEFLQPLLSIIDVPLTACCFAPGNHDQEWGQLEAYSPEKLLNTKSNEEFNSLFEKEAIREPLLKSFTGYTNFVNLTNPPIEGRVDLGCYWIMEFNNQRVKINVLNSSFLSKFLPSESSYGKMKISESQLFSFLKPDPAIDIQIIMSHYPVDFLHPHEKMVFENHLMKVGGIYLHGHIHEMSQMKIIDKNHENGSLLYCPVGPLFTKKNEVGQFSNAFNTISIDSNGNTELKSFIYASSPEPRWVPNVYSGKDDGVHKFTLKKRLPDLDNQDESEKKEFKEKVDLIDDIISMNPHLSSLERALEKKIMADESSDLDHIINQYEILTKEVSKSMLNIDSNKLRQLRVLAFQFGRQLLYTFFNNKQHFFPNIQYSYIHNVLLNIGSEKLDMEIMQKGFELLYSNLDFQDPFFEYSSDEEARIAYECFPFFVISLSLIAFHDTGEFISRILGIEEAEEESWNSDLRKTTYHQYKKELKFVVTVKSKTSFVIVSLVKNILSRLITEGNDSFKRHNLNSPLTSINLGFDSAPQGFKEISFSADVPKLTALVMGRELYGENAGVIFVRELIQNSIDAIRARTRLDSKAFTPEIFISFSEQSNTFIVEDNGVGMSKIEAESYLLKVGRSIWRSKRLNKDPEESPNSIGRFGIGFVSALYVSKLIRISTKRYNQNSNQFGLVIRSVDKPVYIDDKVEKKDVGTRIEVQLTDKLNNEEFHKTLKRFFLFHPEGITFKNPHIPINPEKYLLQLFSNVLNEKYDSSFILGNKVHVISTENAELYYIIPSPEIIERMSTNNNGSYQITNGCVFVSSGSIQWNNPLPSMSLLNKGFFILTLKEGKYSISARRNQIEIPNEIVTALDSPLKITINEQYLDFLNRQNKNQNFFYQKAWENIKKVFGDQIIKNNSSHLEDFCLELTREGKDPTLIKLAIINKSNSYIFINYNNDLFDNKYYQIYRWLKPNTKFIQIKISNRDTLLRSLVNQNIRNMSSSDFRQKIYTESLIPEVNGHPLTEYITEYVAIAKSDFFKQNKLPGLFFIVNNHPSIENIGMERKKNRKSTLACVYINEGHPWTISMSKINTINLKNEKQVKIEQLIYWVLRSKGEDQIKYLNELSTLPLEIGLSDKLISIS